MNGPTQISARMASSEWVKLLEARGRWQSDACATIDRRHQAPYGWELALRNGGRVFRRPIHDADVDLSLDGFLRHILIPALQSFDTLAETP